ncbi:serine/threonine-protein kinase [Microbispora hainanensis]|uniref:serine/threonine-protein kinase n=1 Tax=Microbispora hainanensis TaxID=568844 RepID=UPI001ABF7866|nr:serine/threonine-protein kinase [Microbispora hainanensis]
MDAQPSAGDPTTTHRRTIGPYVPVRRLGEGGMGIVYLATDPRGRQVALKVMRPELAAQEEFRARFRKEAEAAQRVARFCTAPLLDAGHDGDRHYLVTEYVDGPDLSSVIDAQGPLAGSNLDALAVGVATALAAIHEAGIVHRDLKPSNILLSPLGPRVIDFGVAQLADTLAERTGTVIGTPSYMSPEQARGEPVSSAADVFAWGCVIAYAATGRPPFGGGAAPEVLYRVAHHVPHLTGLDERLRSLVEQALDKDPGRRPNAQRLLDRLLGREEVAVEAATRIVSDIWAAPAQTTLRAEGAAKADGAGTGTDRRGGRRWAPVAAVCGALAVSAAVLLVALRPFGGGGTEPKGPLTARDAAFNGSSLHLTVDAVRRRGTSVSVQLTVTLKDGHQWWPKDLFGDQVSDAALVDPPSGSKFTPARRDGGCLCSTLPAQWLQPSDVIPLYATYTGVPEDLETIGLDVPGFGLFADVPVSSE